MISRELILKILESFFQIRLTESRIAAEYSSQQIRCPTHLSLGQEMLPALLSTIMTPNDVAVSTHRCHAHYLSKGGDLTKMILELYGCAGGCAKGRGGSMHLVDTKVNFMGSTAIVGNSIPVGVGLAYSFLLSGEQKRLSFVFLGDGATEEGVFAESVNVAALFNLPVIFVCENNEFSVYTKRENRQPASREIHSLVAAFGIKSVLINVLSFEEAYESIQSLVEDSRNSQSPLFLEIPSWRKVEHCGPNDDDYLNYRESSAIEYWRDNDHEIKLVEFALGRGISLSAINKIRSGIQSELDRVFAEAKLAALDERDSDFDETYAK